MRAISGGMKPLVIHPSAAKDAREIAALHTETTDELSDNFWSNPVIDARPRPSSTSASTFSQPPCPPIAAKPCATTSPRLARCMKTDSTVLMPSSTMTRSSTSTASSCTTEEARSLRFGSVPSVAPNCPHPRGKHRMPKQPGEASTRTAMVCLRTCATTNGGVLPRPRTRQSTAATRPRINASSFTQLQLLHPTWAIVLQGSFRATRQWTASFAVHPAWLQFRSWTA